MTMTREEAIQILAFDECYMSRYSEEYAEAYRMAIDALSVEVQGEWQMCEDFDGEYGICSVCGEDADFSHYGTPYNFCPNCGARMKGGEGK